ncbi:glycosyl transferase [Formicincola oecophyllae]|uniref:Glycosyl transferase n=1 Tax=Formicincola oecophyllae TaxID=2558361 RepID=A0A4Y6UAS2_9PROT|nr:glycosyl transferase [Formicincola oecophyllae]QDH13678.1 glycosyl transferase [Formicincola oecophyllae]
MTSPHLFHQPLLSTKATGTPRRLIVTGGDSAYFPMISELVASIRALPNWRATDLACVDGGLKPAERQRLANVGVQVRAPQQLPLPPQARKALAKRPNLAIGLSKLWLDQLFPNHDTILWLDGDAWVQDGQALADLFTAAEAVVTGAGPQAAPTHAMASVPELFTHKPFRLRWLGWGFAQVRSILYKNSAVARLPWKVRHQAGQRPTLNGGLFALARQAPHWAVLRQWQKTILARKGNVFSSDQLAIGLTAYVSGLPMHYLPVSCNYMGPWFMRSQPGGGPVICEHYWPHKPAGIIHMAGLEAMRRPEGGLVTAFDAESGAPLQTSLRFSALHPDVPLP